MISDAYDGNTTSNVNDDAKYHVRTAFDMSDGWEVQLTYTVDRRTKYICSNGDHPELIRMVNGAKSAEGGAFYINEYKHVIVPGEMGGVDARCVGKYEEFLQFPYNDVTLGPVPPASLVVGDIWEGPHVGTRYVLAAGGDDIYYEKKSGRQTTKRCLSDSCGFKAAGRLAERLYRSKPSGGRFYINEARHFFAPVSEDQRGLQYIYLGALDNDEWFPEPTWSSDGDRRA